MPSAVLDTAIGLVFVFFLVALLCSALTEALSNLMQMRARYLLTGLRAMLDKPESGFTTPLLVDNAEFTVSSGVGNDTVVDRRKPLDDVRDHERTAAAASAVNDTARGANGLAPRADAVADPAGHINSTGLTVALFAHPLLASLQTRRTFAVLWKRVRVPPYVSSRTFTRALVDTLLPDAKPTDKASTSPLEQLARTVEQLPEGLPARKSLQTFLRGAAGDMQRFEGSVEQWYDEAMARIAGSYKRWAKVVLAVAGLLVAVVVNVDAIDVGRQLYVQEPLRQTIVGQATSGASCGAASGPAAQATCVDQALQQVRGFGLPVGWSQPGCTWSHPSACFRPAGQTTQGAVPAGDYVLRVAGWLLTAFAVSFGAPFWFDLLGRFGSLRGAGPKPAS
jgi:hypothetical protein